MRRLLLAALIVGSVPIANAQLNRAAVSVKGLDTNTCTPASPCRTFAQALTVTNSGGEVIALDSGGYGPTSFNRSVSIIAAPGVYAGITATGGDAIDASLIAGQKAVVRGLTLNGLGAINGIVVTGGGTLHVENCVIDGFQQHGIESNSVLIVSNTMIRSIVQFGVEVSNGVSATSAVLDTVTFRDTDFDAISAGFNATVTAWNNVATGGSNYGFAAGNTSVLNLKDCAATNFGIDAVAAFQTATVRASDCVVTDSGGGVYNAATGSVFETWQNNSIRGNTTNVNAIPTNVSEN